MKLTIPEYIFQTCGMIFIFKNMKVEYDEGFVQGIFEYGKVTVCNKLNPEIEVEIDNEFYNCFLDLHTAEFDDGLDEVAAKLIRARTSPASRLDIVLDKAFIAPEPGSQKIIKNLAPITIDQLHVEFPGGWSLCALSTPWIWEFMGQLPDGNWVYANVSDKVINPQDWNNLP